MITFLVLVIVIGVVLLFAITSATAKPTHKSHKHRPGHVDRELVRQRWTTIKHIAQNNGGVGLRNAVSEADKLLDHVLKQRGFRGETMAERLKAAQSQFSDRNAVWRAHKLRNALVHEVEFDLVASQVREALADFERALKDMGAL